MPCSKTVATLDKLANVLPTASAEYVRKVLDTGHLQVETVGGFEAGQIGQKGRIVIGSKSVEVLSLSLYHHFGKRGVPVNRLRLSL